MTEKQEKFRVFLAEDNKEWISLIQEVIEEAGGILVETATTLEDALEIVLKLEELKIDLVILGGSLDEYQEGGEDSLAIIIAMINNDYSFYQKVKKLSFSADYLIQLGLSKLNKYVDEVIDKGEFDKLGPAIVKLMSKDEEIEEVPEE